MAIERFVHLIFRAPITNVICINEFFNLILSNVDMFYCIDEIYLKKSF